jgi:hypothetical protein
VVPDARRPARVRLDSAGLSRAGGAPPPGWSRETFDQVTDALAAALAALERENTDLEAEAP